MAEINQSRLVKRQHLGNLFLVFSKYYDTNYSLTTNNPGHTLEGLKYMKWN